METKDQNQDNLTLSEQNNVDTPIIALMLGGAFLALIHQLLRPLVPADRIWLTYLFLAVGLIIFLTGAASFERAGIARKINKALLDGSQKLKISQIQLVAFFFSIMFSITGTLAAGYEAKLYSAWIALFSWAGAIFLIVYASWESRSLSLRPLRLPLLIALMIFILALALRAVDTTHIPTVLTGDESSSGLSSYNFITGNTNNIFTMGWYSFPSLFFFIQSYSIEILGHTAQSLRLPAAVIGSLTVLSLFLVVRSMFDLRTALIAALLLSFSHYHIQFSRIGLNNIWDGLWFVITLGALWWAWNRERRASFVLAGLALGLSQYFYTSTRGLFVVIPLWILIVAIQDQQRFKRLLPGIIFMAIATIVVVLPLACFYIKFPNEFLAPMSRVSIFGDWLSKTSSTTGAATWKVIIGQITTGLLSFTEKPLQNWYTPGVPILRPIVAWIFYLGIGLMLLRIKDNRFWLIFLWLGIFVIIGAASESTPAAQRFVASAPACMIVAAYGFNRLIGLCEQIWKKNKKVISSIAMILVLFIAMDDSRFYFLDYTPRSEFGGYHGAIAQRLANYLQQYDSSWEVVFSGWPEMGYFSIPSISFLVPQIKGVDYIKPWGDPENIAPDHKNVMFVFLPSRQDDLAACIHQYPGGERITEYWNHNLVLYDLYKIQFP